MLQMCGIPHSKLTKPMRTIRLLILMLFCSTSMMAQVKPTKHDPFASYGMGWTPNKDLTYSGEVGVWGNTSPTSFSLTFDATRSVARRDASMFSKWVGVKAYYTVFSGPKICYMLYAKEALQLGNSSESLLEFGFNPNYTLSDSWLLGVTVGNQVIAGSQWNMFSSIGLVYLLKASH